MLAGRVRPLSMIGAALAILMTYAPAARAQPSDQATYGAIAGYLYDPFGGGIDDVTIFLISVDYHVERHTRTDRTGHFTFGKLPPGEYLLNASIDFVPMATVPVGAGEAVERDLTVRFEPVHGTLTVCARCPVIVAPDAIPPSLTSEFERDLETQPVTAPAPVGGWAWYESTLPYPDGMEDASVSGTVVVEGRIGIDGFAAGAHVTSASDRRLSQGALDAVMHMQWLPARIRSLAFEVPFEITVEYRLHP